MTPVEIILTKIILFPITADRVPPVLLLKDPLKSTAINIQAINMSLVNQYCQWAGHPSMLYVHNRMETRISLAIPIMAL